MQHDFLIKVFDRCKNWHSLSKRLEAKGIGLMDVPGDGNCLVWSLRSLFLGYEDTLRGGFDSPEAVYDKVRIRRTLKDMWMEVRHFSFWQSIFKNFCKDHATDDVVSTPPRKVKGPLADSGLVDLITPPRPVEQRRVARAGQGAGVRIHGKTPPTVEFMQPQKMRRPAMLEAPNPDLEGKIHDLQMKADPPARPADVED